MVSDRGCHILEFCGACCDSLRSAQCVQAFVAAKKRPHIVDDQSFFFVSRSLRQTLATLIGASQDDIALTGGAGAGLATIAHALKWPAGDGD